jgi:hypothetical protein
MKSNNRISNWKNLPWPFAGTNPKICLEALTAILNRIAVPEDLNWKLPECMSQALSLGQPAR